MSTKTKEEQSALQALESFQSYTLTHWLNYNDADPIIFEYVSPISDTVPDMVPDLRLMLDRSQSGIPVPMRQDGYSEEDYPDIWKMDEFQVAEYRTNLAEEMQQMQQELHVSAKRLEELEEATRQQDEQKRKDSVTQQIKNQKETP
jgi:hypothetical protein